MCVCLFMYEGACVCVCGRVYLYQAFRTRSRGLAFARHERFDLQVIERESASDRESRVSERKRESERREYMHILTSIRMYTHTYNVHT